eukprot:SAG11_NODE_1705_length_4412_cov_5.951078_6_plen_257_part_00
MPWVAQVVDTIAALTVELSAKPAAAAGSAELLQQRIRASRAATAVEELRDHLVSLDTRSAPFASGAIAFSLSASHSPATSCSVSRPLSRIWLSQHPTVSASHSLTHTHNLFLPLALTDNRFLSLFLSPPVEDLFYGCSVKSRSNRDEPAAAAAAAAAAVAGGVGRVLRRLGPAVLVVAARAARRRGRGDGGLRLVPARARRRLRPRGGAAGARRPDRCAAFVLLPQRFDSAAEKKPPAPPVAAAVAVGCARAPGAA